MIENITRIEKSFEDSCNGCFETIQNGEKFIVHRGRRYCRICAKPIRRNIAWQLKQFEEVINQTKRKTKYEIIAG